MLESAYLLATKNKLFHCVDRLLEQAHARLDRISVEASLAFFFGLIFRGSGLREVYALPQLHEWRRIYDECDPHINNY